MTTKVLFALGSVWTKVTVTMNRKSLDLLRPTVTKLGILDVFIKNKRVIALGVHGPRSMSHLLKIPLNDFSLLRRLVIIFEVKVSFMKKGAGIKVRVTVF